MGDARKTIKIAHISNFARSGNYLLLFLNRFLYNNIIFFIIIFSLYLINIPIFNNSKLNKEELKKLSLIFVISCFWIYIVRVICPFFESFALRFFLVAFPVLALLYLFLAYHLKKPGFSDLPFDVPDSNFDYQKLYPAQENLGIQ